MSARRPAAGARHAATAAAGRRGATAALAVLALVLAACGDSRPAAAPPGGSTLDATLVDRDGDGFLEAGPGEPFVDRGGHARPGAVIATFAQLTDTHIRDEESPARVTFLDRLGGQFNSTFRPQEAFSTQVLDSAIRAVNAQHPQAVFVTGDIVDNAQSNELTMAIDTLKGGRVDPNSGGAGYEGVQSADDADPFYYRPDHDAPTHPGVLDQAQQPFTAQGLEAPWYPLVGNHDVLAQGEVPPTQRIDDWATGTQLVASLDFAHVHVPTAEAAAQQAVANLLGGGLPPDTHTLTVDADPNRRLVRPGEAEQRLAQAAGHGARPGDYAVDIGTRVRAILIDTVERTGTSQGHIDPQQIEWLKQQLAAAGDRYVLVFTHNPLDSFANGALAALDQDPHVVAAISGNRHKNVITQHGRYWLIGTSSLADFPQQARMFRLRETSGGVVLETWMVDHDGKGLEGVSRELAYLDAQGGRPQHFAGTRDDRNARLYVK